MQNKAKEAPNPDGSMSLSGHLRELRNRILVCVLLLLAVFALCLSFAPRIVTLLTDMGKRFDYVYVYIAPQELFLVYMNVALVGAAARLSRGRCASCWVWPLPISSACPSCCAFLFSLPGRWTCPPPSASSPT